MKDDIWIVLPAGLVERLAPMAQARGENLENCALDLLYAATERETKAARAPVPRPAVIPRYDHDHAIDR